MDNSAGHGKKLEGGLDVNVMRKKWGGKRIDMRDTVVPENAPYGATHLVGSVQHMHFQEEDEGPIYLSPQNRQMQKYPIRTGVFKTRKKTRQELLQELKKKTDLAVRGHYTTEQLENYARNFNLPLEIREEVVKPVWVGANKGMLQVLWEREFINIEEIGKYSLDGKKS